MMTDCLPWGSASVEHSAASNKFAEKAHRALIVAYVNLCCLCIAHAEWTVIA